MHAVRRVQADTFAVRLRGIVHHLVYICRTEILAGAAEFLYATRVADVGVMNDQMCGLVFFVLGAGVIEVGEFIESQFAIAFGRAEQVSFVAAVRRQPGKLLQVLVARQSKYIDCAGRVRR